jgi:two-component system NarL family sensor kinase
VHLKLDQQRDILNAILVGQETERKRIGEDLHDGVGQLLYSLKMKQQMIDSADEKSTQTLKEMDKLLDQTISATRSLSFQLVPAVLRDYGLKEALSSLIHRLNSPSLRITFQATGITERLPESVEFSLYSIAQELLTNIVRHSGAKSGVVDIRVAKNQIVLNVSDDGSGFDAEQIGKLHKGIGLQPVMNRASLLKANVQISSSEGHGTSVTLTMK